MRAEDNKAIVRRVLDAWADAANTGNPDIFDDVYAVDHVEHANGLDSTLKETKGATPIIHRIFGDAQFEIHEQIAEGDRVATRYTLHFTHRGEWRGISPTGKRVTLNGMSVDRILRGKVVESWVLSDSEGLERQLREESGESAG